mmetsp:Transcript_13097/g.28408  ORF Transcript_13097/g.28408 Transcript_13097/m.28408 type:complete len:272 (+) Transcript_13097:81-896(+)
MSGASRQSDELWSKSRNLLVRIYRPAEAKSNGCESPKLPAILDLHGGMWNNNDRTLDQVCNKALAEAGFLVAAIDFRQGPTHQHPAASQDAIEALHWLRNNADRLNIDPNRIGILGTSSGGHLAMYAGLTPNSKYHGAAQVHAPPKFIMALWPVSDPYQRYRYAKRAKIQRLVEAHDAYFVTEDNMREASVPRLVVAGEAETIPPLLVVQPGEDGNVPAEINLTLVRAYQDRGGYVEYCHFPGEPHAFGLKESAATQRMIDLVISFSNRFA